MAADATAPAVTQALCESFSAAADALLLRRAGDIQEADIDAFVALQWMDWHGGTLRLTALGQLVLMQLRERFARESA